MNQKLEKFEKDFNEIKNKTIREYYVLEVTCTNQCNMRCSYCLEKEHGYKKEEASQNFVSEIISKVNFLLSNEKFNSLFEGVKLDFWGGEPTLKTGALKEIINAFINQPKVLFHIYSNGYQVDEFLEFLNSLKGMVKEDHQAYNHDLILFFLIRDYIY